MHYEAHAWVVWPSLEFRVWGQGWPHGNRAFLPYKGALWGPHAEWYGPTSDSGSEAEADLVVMEPFSSIYKVFLQNLKWVMLSEKHLKYAFITFDLGMFFY